MNLEAKNLDTPDDKRSFEHGELHLVSIGGATIGRAVFNPGWKWSEDVKPSAGTDSCQVTHTGYVMSGRLHVRMDDGEEIVLGPGDAHVVGPGHDAWVVGNEPCVALDFGGPAKSAPVDDAAIVRTIEAYLERLNASDVLGVLDLYTDDGVLMQPEEETAVGHRQLQAAYERGFAAADLDFRISRVDNIHVDGDLASARTATTGTVTVRANGAVVPAASREAFTLRRVDGEWKIAQYMFQHLPVK